jgi:phage terminase large subunit
MLKDAWLYGRWDVFEGQFFPEFDPCRHVGAPNLPLASLRCFAAFDYGLDMLAALVLGVDGNGNLYVLRECCLPDLTLRQAAQEVASLCEGLRVEYAVASPDLWNRRQDTGRSGFEIMQATPGMPPMCAADNRRVAGWRILREYLHGGDGHASLLIAPSCRVLIDSLPALLCDANRPEDASGEPHAVTHAPEALRYAVMSRTHYTANEDLPDRNFRFASTRKDLLF